MDDQSHSLTPDEHALLSSWEEIYMRGHFTFWVLLAIRSGSDGAQDITAYIQAHASNIQVNEQSLYRALRRYDDAGLVDVSYGITKKHKKYILTAAGNHVLSAFIDRNITPLQHITKDKESS